MPRRTVPDPLSTSIGRRVRELREEEGMSMGELAAQSKGLSKGHVSSIEQGLVRPTSHTLKVLADGLGVLPLDLLTFPWRSLRQRLVDITRRVSSLDLAATFERLRASAKRSAG
jgi:transcriptional regulator with XRE-family HTH domain